MALVYKIKTSMLFRNYVKLNRKCRGFCTQYRIPTADDGYEISPKYPPILDNRKKVVARRQEESWYSKIQRQQTVEEKLFEINVPRYWGWKSLMLKEGQLPYNSLAFNQYITRTHVLAAENMPEFYSSNKELAGKLSNDIKGCIEDEIQHQLSIQRINKGEVSEMDQKNLQTKLIVNAINRIVLREIAINAPHLAESEIDYNPRIEAFWSIGGLDPPETVIKRRKAEKLKDDELKEPIDRWVQYLGSPILQIRNEKPLGPIWEDEIETNVPVWNIDPDLIGYESEHRHGTSIPGFWPGDSRNFSLLSYHLSNHVHYRPPSYGSDEAKEAIISQGILASFGWLVPLAAYHGFSPFSEITYPYVTQTVLTDGREFTFMVYQMNTNKLYSEFATENPKTNIAWCSQTENLYNCIEDDKIKGLDENVLAKLIQMYLNEPRDLGINQSPYLGDAVKLIADYEDDEKRCWLEKEFKHFSANRPRHRVDLQYELYEWERIYKVEHQTRPMDPKRRPFELRQRPYQRKMSDHPGTYIPRALRPDKDKPKKTQVQFRKTYYPQ